MKYVIGTIMILIGIFISVKSEWMLKIFGYNSWAENKFRTWGGSRTFYKLFGLVLVFVALFIMTNILQNFLVNLFSPKI